LIQNYLRLATLDDIPTLLRFAKNFHRASPYRGMRFDSQKGKEFLEGIIIGRQTEGIVLVALKDSQPIGMLVGACSEPVFTRSKVAMELGWWIEEEFRKTKASFLIYKAYEDWAFRVGCSHVQGAYLPGVSPELDEFYKKRGYIQVESSYLKTLKVDLS
jgi:RimJ/RimL family protein N-acetyltransferase